MPSFLHDYIYDHKYQTELDEHDKELAQMHKLAAALKLHQDITPIDQLNWQVSTFKNDLKKIVEAQSTIAKSEALIKSTIEILQSGSEPFKEFIKREDIIAKLKKYDFAIDRLKNPDQLIEEADTQYEQISSFIFQEVMNNYIAEQTAAKISAEEKGKVEKIHHLNILAEYMHQTSADYKPKKKNDQSVEKEKLAAKATISSQQRIGGVDRFFFPENALDNDEEITKQQLDEIDKLLEERNSWSTTRYAKALQVKLNDGESSRVDIRAAISDLNISLNNDNLAMTAERQAENVNQTKAALHRNFKHGLPDVDNANFYINKIIATLHFIASSSSLDGSPKDEFNLIKMSTKLESDFHSRYHPFTHDSFALYNAKGVKTKVSPEEYLAALLKMAEEKKLFGGSDQLQKVKEMSDVFKSSTFTTDIQKFKNKKMKGRLPQLLESEDNKQILAQGLAEVRGSVLDRSVRPLDGEISDKDNVDLINHNALSATDEANLNKLLSEIRKPLALKAINQNANKELSKINSITKFDNALPTLNDKDGKTEFSNDLLAFAVAHPNYQAYLVAKPQNLGIIDKLQEELNISKAKVDGLQINGSKDVANKESEILLLIKQDILKAFQRFRLEQEKLGFDPANLRKTEFVFKFMVDMLKQTSIKKLNAIWKKFDETYKTVDEPFSKNAFNTLLYQQMHNTDPDNLGVMTLNNLIDTDLAVTAAEIIKPFLNIVDTKAVTLGDAKYFLNGAFKDIKALLGKQAAEMGPIEGSKTKELPLKDRVRLYAEMPLSFQQFESDLESAKSFKASVQLVSVSILPQASAPPAKPKFEKHLLENDFSQNLKKSLTKKIDKLGPAAHIVEKVMLYEDKRSQRLSSDNNPVILALSICDCSSLGTTKLKRSNPCLYLAY